VEQDGRFRYTDRFAKLMEPMITPDAMRKMLADLNRLREKVEAQPYEPELEPEVGESGVPADSAGAGH
jgi:hypothetical protein